MRPKVIVVEGKNDAFKISAIFPEVEIVTTNGSAIDQDAVDLLKKLDLTHDIILFTDPDHAGERIRRLLSKSLQHVFHVFLDQDLAISGNGKKVGIEHATRADILKALEDIKMVSKMSQSDVTHAFLHDVGLTGSPDSQWLRDVLSSVLGIGKTNGKSLYQRLRMFDITQEKIIEVLRESSGKEEIRTELFKR
jgi:ribonuclease M5